MFSKYYVIIIDIISSTKLPDRNKVTVKLKKAIDEVNKNYAKDCFAPFEITRGDEVAAVLTSIVNIYNIINHFCIELFPVNFRVIIVYDELTSGLDSKRSSIIDGPAFHKGNDMMVHLKKTQKTFTLDTGKRERDQAVEALMNLLLWLWNDFTPLQQKVIRLYQSIRNQEKVAKKINRTQQQVQVALEACRWQVIDAAEKTIKDLFKIIDNQIKKRKSENE